MTAVPAATGSAAAVSHLLYFGRPEGGSGPVFKSSRVCHTSQRLAVVARRLADHMPGYLRGPLEQLRCSSEPVLPRSGRPLPKLRITQGQATAEPHALRLYSQLHSSGLAVASRWQAGQNLVASASVEIAPRASKLTLSSLTGQSWSYCLWRPSDCASLRVTMRPFSERQASAACMCVRAELATSFSCKQYNVFCSRVQVVHSVL